MVTCAMWPPPFGGGRFALPPMAGQCIRAGAPNRANLRQPVHGAPRRFRRHAPCYVSAHGTLERSDGKGAAGARGVPRHGAGGGGVPGARRDQPTRDQDPPALAGAGERPGLFPALPGGGTGGAPGSPPRRRGSSRSSRRSRTRGTPIVRASASSSSSHGRFVILAFPPRTGPATPKHAAATVPPGSGSRNAPTIPSSDAYSRLGNVRARISRSPLPDRANRASSVFVPPTSPARIDSPCAARVTAVLPASSPLGLQARSSCRSALDSGRIVSESRVHGGGAAAGDEPDGGIGAPRAGALPPQSALGAHDASRSPRRAGREARRRATRSARHDAEKTRGPQPGTARGQRASGRRVMPA